MRRKRRNSNTVTIVGIALLAVVLFAAVPFVGDWILESFIYPGDLECRQELKLEAGQPMPQAEDFFAAGGDGASFLTDMSVISTSVPGTYPVELKAGNRTFASKLVIVDTVAPTAQGQNIVYAGGELKAETFVTGIQDATAVSVTFAAQPELTASGTQQITVLLTDAGGNTAAVNATLTVIIDREAPVISGARDLEAYVGETISYKSGVTVADNADTKPDLEIDNSQVDLSKAGTYTVTYKATDAAGNTETVTVKVTVREKPENYVDPEVIYAKADAILAQFIRDDMTDREKVEAVYVWTRRGVHLTYGSKPSGFVHEDADWLQTAYALLNRDVAKGDCYFFFAVQKLLLQRLNIPTIDVEKTYDGHSRHYWLLVSVDGGKTYYHFDNVWSRELCLVTDAQLDVFSAAAESNPDIGYDPFIRDKSKYPATPTEKLPASTLPWEDPAILAAKP